MHRIRFEKTGRAVWMSHLDLMRLMQRAFRRAGVLLHHSQGFTPHAYVSMLLPLSVGMESVCELMEYELDGELAVTPEALNAVLPEGVRVLEVYESTGQPMSELAQRARGEPAYRCLRLGLDYRDRALLYERIDRRVDLMMEQGLLGEVRALAAQPGVQGGTALAAIGYKEFLPLLRGEGSLPDAVAAVKQASRRYAKRQRTWFYRHADTHWFYRDRQDDNSILSQMISLFRNTF